MNEGFAYAVLAVLVMFGWVVVWVVRDRFVKRQRLRLREMLHAERMAALERGVELPDSDTDDLLVQSLEGFPGTAAGRGRSAEAARRLLRRAALGLGLLLTFAGVGFWVGLAAVPETPQTLGMRELASLGAVPALAGLGLLLYWFLLGRERD